MLEIKNLNKSFKQNHVLKDISFKIEKGEIGVLLGKSGAGKTTLLRCINGLEEFDNGKIIIDDKINNNSKDILTLKGKIGMVFQNFNLFPHLSVIENIIEAPVNVFKETKKEALERSRELLDIVDLKDKEDFYPYELSGGQQQRVAIARACALMPKVLCFDEPTSALDKDTIKSIVNVMKKLKSQGITILIITHDIGFANEVADKLITISKGVVECVEEVS
ncbi:amino acid ABC transporter ATP-binding protein [Romboutsia ilealis]|uniref:Amino acid ABC transporter ATP-binding protein n=1 Tax=Romboutsia faecis TaxID=2764597 RepID=A0ABR7JQ13_9FIRM|nr:amino acid ABC transporter ATP-binding protein [Romboutsia faecis]MBC5996681.1 amino acid ABC transporter ATP-binding protein [Romboutsia faecis]MRN24207.1 amino acid ABC transporter ATP-binding protein [Romboutsia ilealis]